MTDSIASLASIGAVVYASTNVDDLLVLAVFFASPHVRVGAIIAGRFIGLAVLVLVSCSAALLALAVSAEWIALLGFVPLFLGLRLLPALFRNRTCIDSPDNQTPDEVKDGTRGGFTAQALSVAGVTLANGGDNLGVYIPLFASTPSAIAIYVLIFAVMTAVWCGLGYLAVNNPLMGDYIRRYGHIMLPLVLIPLGLFILSGAIPLLR